jgi:hypothetical protein
MNKKITFYMVLTGCCLFLDGISLIFCYSQLTETGNSHLELLLLLEVCCYICLNAALPLLFMSAKANTSPHLFDFITDALLGATSTMHDRIKIGFNEIKTRKLIKEHNLSAGVEDSNFKLSQS